MKNSLHLEATQVTSVTLKIVETKLSSKLFSLCLKNGYWCILRSSVLQPWYEGFFNFKVSSGPHSLVRRESWSLQCIDRSNAFKIVPFFLMIVDRVDLGISYFSAIFSAIFTFAPHSFANFSTSCKIATFVCESEFLEAEAISCLLAIYYELSCNSHLKSVCVNRKFLISMFALSKADNTVLIWKPTKPTRIYRSKRIFTITVFALMRLNCNCLTVQSCSQISSHIAL